MAHGRPDFFGTPIHPKYGVVTQFDDTTVIPSRLETTVKEIIGKGSFFYGEIYTTDADAMISDIIRLYLDDKQITARQWQQLIKMGFVPASEAVFVITLYNPDIPDFKALFRGMLPFNNKLKITYYVAGPLPVSVGYVLDYYDVTV